MNENLSFPPTEGPPDAGKKPIGLALLLAFTPAILFLVFLTLMFTGGFSDPPGPVLMALSLLSVVLCIVSSAMLFRRRAGAMVAFAIVLMLMNAFIAFAFGCGALITMDNFH